MAKPVFGKEKASERVSNIIGLPSVTEEDITYIPNILREVI